MAVVGSREGKKGGGEGIMLVGSGWASISVWGIQATTSTVSFLKQPPVLKPC